MPTTSPHLSWAAEGRVCRGCREYKTREHFTRDMANSTGLKPRCKECLRKQIAEARRRDPDHKRKTRDYWLRKTYGITLEDYEAMLRKQRGRCAACGCVPAESGRWGSFHVDHCHETGKVCGLLCSNCNVALGYAQNDPDRLTALARYARRTRK